VNLLIGALTIGLILALLAIGVYISFRIADFADITVEGSLTLGAAVAATLLVAGAPPVWATLAGAVAGAVAGSVTGVLHTRFNIHGLLSGILVMTALYSVNLRVMGRSNIPLLSVHNATDYADALASRLTPSGRPLNVMGWEVATRDAAILLSALGLVAIISVILYLFFRTKLGTAMRCTGDNPQMARALGVDTGMMIIITLALANFLSGLAGALLAQYQGFADVQMGLGMLVWGLASVIIGETLVRTRRLGLAITGAVMGSLLFRLLVAIALRLGLDPNDLKLITAAFVLGALILPGMLAKIKTTKREAPNA
jgi:putative ABC transport system permease protein